MKIQPNRSSGHTGCTPFATPSISVVVPVHNGAPLLEECLESLGDSEYGNCELIVVDDCSDDSTPEIIQRYGVRSMRTPRRVGPAGARNLGALHASGEIVVFVDADVAVPPGVLDRIAYILRENPTLDAVFGSYDDEPACKTFISQYKNLMHHYVHQSSSEVATTFWSGCGAVRRSVFLEIGGFDDAQYDVPSIEDIALGLKLNRGGHAVRLDKQIHVKHLKCWTARGLLKSDILHRAVPWTRLILQSGQMPRDLNLDYASRASAGLVCVLGLTCLALALSSFAGQRVNFVALAVLGAVVCAALVGLNRKLYRFFWRKRGLLFAFPAMLAHWAYYLYSAGTFAALFVEHTLKRLTPKAAPAAQKSIKASAARGATPGSI